MSRRKNQAVDVRFFDSIATQLFRAIFGLYLFVAIFITSIQLTAEYFHVKDEITQDLRKLQKTIGPGISESLWEFNKQLLQTTLVGMYEMSVVAGVQVRDSKGNNFLTIGSVPHNEGKTVFEGQNGRRPFPDHSPQSDNAQLDSELFGYTFPAIYIEKDGTRNEIGSVAVYSSNDIIYNRVKYGFFLIIINSVIKTLILWGIFYFFLSKILSKPLSDLTLAVSKVNPDNLSNTKIKLNTARRNELKVLEDSFNTMITKLFQSTEEIVKSEQKYQDLYNGAPDMFGSVDVKTATLIDCNNTLLEATGYTKEEIIGRPVFSLYSEQSAKHAKNNIFPQFVKSGSIEGEELQLQRKDGSIIDVLLKVSAVRDKQGAILSSRSSWRDISERKRAEEKIKASLKEKETLLHEIHHRVKNNMQVINSLLKLQSESIEDQRVKNILKDSQSRVYAMSAVHEVLHGSEKLSDIDLKYYLSKITASIFKTYSSDQSKIKLNSDIENLPISLNQAYPLGLIINELISNALKYAFPDGRKGEISVSMQREDNELELTVKDNGVGLPEDLDWKNSKSLGLKLVGILVKNQLEGSIDMENNQGTKFSIKFNIET